MNSEKMHLRLKQNRPTKGDKLLLGICKILSDIKIKSDPNLMTSLLLRIKNIVGDGDFYIQNEVVEFIRQSKPKNLVEVYHFLNMFQLCETIKHTSKITRKKDIFDEVKQSYTKLNLKAISEYSKSMISIGAYRNGVNIVNNNQNNTLNQLNIGKIEQKDKELKPAEIEHDEQQKLMEKQDKEELRLIEKEISEGNKLGENLIAELQKEYENIPSQERQQTF